jgi:hypothetical protein
LSSSSSKGKILITPTNKLTEIAVDIEGRIDNREEEINKEE